MSLEEGVACCAGGTYGIADTGSTVGGTGGTSGGDGVVGGETEGAELTVDRTALDTVGDRGTGHAGGTHQNVVETLAAVCA